MGKERKRKAKKTTSSTKKKGNFFLAQYTWLKFLKIDSLQQEITSMYHGDGILQDHVQSKTAQTESYFEFFPYQSSNFLKHFFSFFLSILWHFYDVMKLLYALMIQSQSELVNLFATKHTTNETPPTKITL